MPEKNPVHKFWSHHCTIAAFRNEIDYRSLRAPDLY